MSILARLLAWLDSLVTPVRPSLHPDCMSPHDWADLPPHHPNCS